MARMARLESETKLSIRRCAEHCAVRGIHGSDGQVGAGDSSRFADARNIALIGESMARLEPERVAGAEAKLDSPARGL